MRKILLLVLPLLFCVLITNAQYNNSDDAAALQLVSATKASLGLSAEDLANVKVTNTYVDNSSGIRMVYLIQTYQGIPVYNQMLVLAFKNGKLVSNQGSFNHSAEKIASQKTVMPSVSAESAVQSALSERSLRATQMAFALSTKDNGHKVEFGDMGVSRENITAELMWVPVEQTVNNKTVVTRLQLAWQVYIIPKTTSDYWLVRVDASNNNIIGKTNLTEYDNWGTPQFENNSLRYPAFTYGGSQTDLSDNSLFDFKKVSEDPNLITTATYRVIPFPAEAPSFPNGAHALRTDPWLSAPGNATTLKWHTGTAGTDYSYSRGNNVWAYEDRTAPANTGTQAKSANSTTALPNLTFDFTPDYTQPPTTTTPPNQQFNITNLFYWNNVMHDLMYVYGFTEAAANFQDDNLGRGGVGNDHVNAEAQDAGGTNNANFATPADGGSGRMQMYLWTLSSPQRDGDVDNGVICHEFGHGISNRFTGGGTSGCLGNAEQMGEGWGDYNALMFTQDWATSTLNTGFNSPRGIGTYALNQPPTGLGIRSQKYCTDFTINNKVYAASIPAAPHDRGEIWCATLWDMTWNIINQVGTINPNLYNLAGGGGNTIAFKLVNEGMRLQQCNPGFISGRNAILAADQALYGGAYSCSIWEAFRRRGMGAFASEGSTNSVTDQIADFTPPVTFGATVSATTIPEGQNLIYTNSVFTCSAITGYTLRDTLPANVTYVSGGTYDAVNRVVSFPVNQGAGTTNYPFTVNVNLGSYFPPFIVFEDIVVGATIPATWSTSSTTASVWVSSTARSHSAPNSYFSVNTPVISDQRLFSTNPIVLGATPPDLTFWHWFETEATYDGGILEISTDGGANYNQVLNSGITEGGYTGTMDASTVLAGRLAWTGTSAGWARVRVPMTPYANQSIKLRFRSTTDLGTNAEGWYIDDIAIKNIAVVKMRSSLFNASNTRVFLKDMETEITPLVACAPSITQQPTDVTICAASSTSFTCVGNATGGVTYQWQVSTTGTGGPFTNLTNTPPYTGATASILTINPTAVGMNGYVYRCVVTGGCAPTATSTNAILTVVAASIGGTVTPANSSVCGTPNAGTLTLSGHTGLVVRWESATVLAGPYTPIANTTTTLTFNNITQTTYYRAVVQVTGCAAVTSAVATVTFNAAAGMMIVADPGTTLCQGDPALLTATNAPSISTFSNVAPITIPALGAATPYPSSITVSGLPATGIIIRSVNINGYSHTFPADVDVLLVSPLGVKMTIMSDVGGGTDAVNANLVLDDAAAGLLPAAIVSGTFRPTNTGTGDTYPAPAPPAPYLDPATAGAATLNSAFGGQNPNGTWSLYIVDDLGGDAGTLSGGWSITFSVPGGPIVGGTFTWTPPIGLNQTTGNPVGASPPTTTTYTVFHDNGAGCVRQASITLNINQRPAVTAQPASITRCNSGTATFTVTATGTGITYQWQESTNGGASYTNLNNGAPYSGVNTATLTINPITLAMNNNRYRCAISGVCPPVAFSNGAILTVSPLPVVTATPPSPVCGGLPGVNGIPLTASGTATSYVWTPNGTGSGLYTNAGATTVYTGTDLATVYAAPDGVNTIYTVTGTSTTTGCSNTATVAVVFTPPPPTVTPASVTMCLGDVAVKLKSSSSVTTNVSFCSGPVNVPIPEGAFPAPPPTAGISTVTVSGIPANAVIDNFTVTSNITHAYVGDVVMVIKAPNGQIYNLDALLNKTNNPGANFLNTIISPTGTTTLDAGTAPWTGTYKADAVGATFVAFGFTLSGGPVGYIPTTSNASTLYTPSSAAAGTWTLAMYDAGAPDVGNLTSWCLNITYHIGVITTPATWSPVTGLYSDANASIAYVAGTEVDSVWTRPTTIGVNPYSVTVKSYGFPGYTTFSNPAAITIPSSGTGTPYPSNIVVSGLPTSGASVDTVVIRGLSHTWSNDIDVMLQSATGQNVILMSDVGGTGGLTNVTYTFSDAAPAMNTGAPNATGTYHPTNFDDASGLDNWPTPGPGAFTQPAPALSLFGNTANVNGTWKLLVVDDVGGDQGSIANGWSITFKAPLPGCVSPARIVNVTVNQPTSIVTQPVAKTVCTDGVATFTVVAGGTGPFTYQWQESINSGQSYTNITNGGIYSGATTATLTLTAPPVSNPARFYRCIVTGAAPCAPLTSFFAILTVNPLPTVVIAPPFTSLYPGRSVTLTSSVSPFAAATGGYTWLRDGSVVQSGSLSTYTVTVDGFGKYRLRVTDVNGCVGLSNEVTVADSTTGRCYIYPNPTSGKFQVRYYSSADAVRFPRTITVYDAQGNRILTQTYPIGRPYQRMDVDLRNHGKGLYWVEVGDLDGNRLSMCRVVIQ